MREITSHQTELDGQPVFWRSAGGGQPPVLFVHGVPTSSDDWGPFLARTGGLAPDLPGFGRSGKRGDLDYSIFGYGNWLGRYLDAMDVERVRLVLHDWGAVALALAQAQPERVERLVLINAVPLLPDYHWHRVARLWRTPLVGELVMGATTRPTLRVASRSINASPGPMPTEWISSVAEHLDQGTQRAILRLYRSSPPAVLADAGSRLDRVRCPALVVWGDRDPFVPATFADAYAAALPGAEAPLHLPDAGHWPWLDRPDLVETVAQFLEGK